MVKAVTVTMVKWWALLVPLLTPTTHAQDLPFNPDDLLAAPAHLTRSGTSNTPCLTPDKQQGVCGSAVICQPYLPLLSDLGNKTVLIFFRERICRQSPGLIHVCCPVQGAHLAPKPTSSSSLSFNQPARGDFHRPSQRPNNRQPIQGSFREENNDEEEEKEKIDFLNVPVQPMFFPPATPQPQPSATAKPRPPTRFTTTTTTRAPTLFIPQSLPSPSVGIFLSPDRGPIIPGTPNISSPAPLPITEPSPPPILPTLMECGFTSQGSTTHPWAVGVGVLDNGVFQVVCGGALISQLHVIVAAHCLQSPTPTLVRLGDLQQSVTTVDKQILIRAHPNFEPNTLNNDIALLTFTTPVTFTDKIRPVCLPFPYRLDGFVGQQVQVVGWGGAISVEEGTLQVIGLGQCRKAYTSPSLISNNKVALFSRTSTTTAPSFSPLMNSRVVVDRQHLCGSPAPSASSSTICLSDHGAPLFYQDIDTTGKYFLVGVSSIGVGCDAGPGLYTRVGAFIPWLVKQLSTVGTSTGSPAPSPVTNPTLASRLPELTRRMRG